MPLNERERELLRLLRLYLGHLGGHSAVEPASVEPFGAVDAAVRCWLQLSIQCCLDIGDSVLGRVGEPEPPRYRDIFPALERRGIIPAQVAREMERLNGVSEPTLARVRSYHSERDVARGAPWCADPGPVRGCSCEPAVNVETCGGGDFAPSASLR